MAIYYLFFGVVDLLQIRYAVPFFMVLPMFPRLVLSILHFLCQTSTWHLDSCPLRDTWYGVALWVIEFNARALKQSVRDFTAEPLSSLSHNDELPKGRNSCLQPTPQSVFSSFSVVLMSCKVNFHVVRSALQNSVCLFSVYFCWSDPL